MCAAMVVFFKIFMCVFFRYLFLNMKFASAATHSFNNNNFLIYHYIIYTKEENECLFFRKGCKILKMHAVNKNSLI